jgi:hypothetical protein
LGNEIKEMMDRNSFNVGGALRAAIGPGRILNETRIAATERASHIGGTQGDQNKDNPNNTLVPTVAKRSGGTV